MFKLGKLGTMMVFLFSLLILVGSVSAADLTVNSNTSHKNISDWIDASTTVSGNNLIFDVSTYGLSDTLVLSKSINVKSDKNTQINFNKNKEMIKISANEISFSGLILNHNGKGVYGNPTSVILAPLPAKTLTIKDTSINLNGDYTVAVTIGGGKLDFINSHIKGNGIYNYAVVCDDLNVNFQKSSFTFNKDYGSGVYAYTRLIGDFIDTKITLQGISAGISSPTWTGKFINSEITGKSQSSGIYVNNWNGQISGSKIIITGAKSEGFHSKNAKGTISKSTIHVKNGYAVTVSSGVKVSVSSIISKKGEPGVYYIGPRMHILKISSFTKSKVYTFRIFNKGESKSKASQLIITSGKFKKTVKVKGIKAGVITKVKVTLPPKYASSKTKKAAKVVFYNSAGKKESSKTLKFKF